jgi:hypothetical protein|tara:strand:- start:858 stop:1430 length:573 start_codon:yes stop_codon:yes gene_type:complete
MDYQKYIEEQQERFTRPKFYDTTISLTSYDGKTGSPNVNIKVNDKSYYNKTIKDNVDIKFTVQNWDNDQVLTIAMDNKDPYDTIVKDNKIVADKFVSIDKIVLDGVDIKQNIYEGRHFPVYQQTQTGEREVTTTSLYYNGDWVFKYKNPPIKYFAEKELAKSLFSKDDKQKANLDAQKKYLEMVKFLQEH